VIIRQWTARLRSSLRSTSVSKAQRARKSGRKSYEHSKENPTMSKIVKAAAIVIASAFLATAAVAQQQGMGGMGGMSGQGMGGMGGMSGQTCKDAAG
jgi:hypothetical protein